MANQSFKRLAGRGHWGLQGLRQPFLAKMHRPTTASFVVLDIRTELTRGWVRTKDESNIPSRYLPIPPLRPSISPVFSTHTEHGWTYTLPESHALMAWWTYEELHGIQPGHLADNRPCPAAPSTTSPLGQSSQGFFQTHGVATGQHVRVGFIERRRIICGAIPLQKQGMISRFHSASRLLMHTKLTARFAKTSSTPAGDGDVLSALSAANVSFKRTLGTCPHQRDPRPPPCGGKRSEAAI